MRLIFCAGIAFGLLPASIAYAGLFDDINNAVQAVKNASTLMPSKPTSSSDTLPSQPAGQATASNRGSTLDLPFNFSSYSRARLATRIDNPLERLSIPISTPQRTPDGYVARYSVPMEGKVTMLSYAHRSDDSPLLIRQYYEAWMAQAGFERLLICETPCSQLASHNDWRGVVDPTERLDSNYLPDKPTYIAGYKADAMVLVGIGKHLFDYSSVVKIVEGRVLDPQPWLTLTAPKIAAPAVSLSQPVPELANTKTTQRSTVANGQVSSDWYGKYGWEWAKIPAGTKLRLSGFLGQKATKIFATPDNQKSKTTGFIYETDIAEYMGKSSVGFVQVRTQASSGWVDYRSVEPIDAANARSSTKTTATGLAAGAPASATQQVPLTAPSINTVDDVDMIASADLAARLSASKGLVTVQFSSYDANCSFCVAANPTFDALAARNKGKATFIRVMYQPWQNLGRDPFSKTYGVTGIPTTFTFKNGQMVRRVNGSIALEEMERKVLNGL